MYRATCSLDLLSPAHAGPFGVLKFVCPSGVKPQDNVGGIYLMRGAGQSLGVRIGAVSEGERREIVVRRREQQFVM